MQVPVLDMSGKQVQEVELPADIFEVKINVGLMHQAYVRQAANARLGTHSTQTRGEVTASKAKIYRQKGTGRARHGARSATQFVGGGRPFGPRPRKYTQSMPKKMRQGAIRSALSALLRDEQLVFVDKIDIDAPKTKEMAAILNNLAGDAKTLVLMAGPNDNVLLSVKNLDRAQTLRVNYLNMRDLLTHDKIIVPLDALDIIKQLWGREN
jgi:large subunit ribosomal protein L4